MARDMNRWAKREEARIHLGGLTMTHLCIGLFFAGLFLGLLVGVRA